MFDRHDFYAEALKVVNEICETPDIVVIGAMDGVSFDHLAEPFKKYRWSGIFIEPIKHYVDKMVEYHDSLDYPNNNTYINCAVSTYNGEIKMVVMDTKPIEDGEIMEDFGGMSSVYPPKNGMNKVQYEKNKEAIEEYSSIVKVPCKKLNTIIRENDIKNIDVLQIDTEGHDWKILRQLSLKNFRPKVIRVEYANLESHERESMLRTLDNSGYLRQEKLASDVDFYLPEVYNEVILRLSNTK